MKRPLLFRLAGWWCALYTLMLLVGLSKANRQSSVLRIIVDLIPAIVMAYGTLALYQRKRWAPWVCASTLALLTLWLPFGYSRTASLPGADQNRLLVTFSLLALINMSIVAVLVCFGYRARKIPSDTSAPRDSVKTL